MTAEDPVEYDIDGLIQCQINPDQELTFAKLLRSFLRQDPDIILVGEIRDLETAQIAVQASLTGHLVFTTVHTNDAPSTVLRLTDLGMEPFLLTATIEAIVAQRLVRRICVGCKQAYEPSEEELMELDLRPSDVEGRTFFRGTGCDKCNNTGFKGGWLCLRFWSWTTRFVNWSCNRCPPRSFVMPRVVGHANPP